MVVNELDALREKYEGCRTIAFADLSTQMILITDSGSNHRREVLDKLCAEAAFLLGTTARLALGEKPSNVAVVASPSALRIFVRAKVEPNDILCCICEPGVDAGAFLADARASLERISSDE